MFEEEEEIDAIDSISATKNTVSMLKPNSKFCSLQRQKCVVWNFLENFLFFIEPSSIPTLIAFHFSGLYAA
jgi:hypothetical protein